MRLKSDMWCSLFIVLMYFVSVSRGSEKVTEAATVCPSYQFGCANGRCIPISWHCDDDNDCGDNTDEESCESRTCSWTEFKCRNQKCIPTRWLCDNEDDCGDKTDEDPQHCQNKTCAPDQFSCGSSSGLCIPITWRCDGQEDCADGSDEKDNCRQITCTEDEFTCDNNKCITRRWVCDQDNDCGDMSDEVACPNVTCSSTEFMCLNGKCIPERWRCDGDFDCLDGSDENTCPKQTIRSHCNEREFMCTSGDCIHASWQCDGDPDCPDRSDEANCTINCRSDHFQCHNKRCIPGTQQCNGVRDCTDGSDETNCPTLLPKDCNNRTEFDCGNKKCIPIELTCNHQNDCGGWEDEPSDKCFINECLQNNGGCSQKCVDDVVGFHCECHTGYQLHDNRSCKDIDECQIPGSCSQLCNNTKGSFKCSCIEGYSIEPSNHVRCKAQLGHGALLFANRRDLRKIDLETSEYTLIASGLRSAVAIDYDFEKKLVVWTDVLEESIYSASLENGTSNAHNGSTIKTVVKDKIITPDGLAVDWVHSNVYWTDTGRNAISVASLDGKLIKLLFGTNLDEPRAIVVNPLEGWLFWADWGELAKIERAGMDGTHRSVIVSKEIAWPNGLTIDFVSKKIFWADAKFHILCSSDYDGSNVKVILSSATKVKHPFSLDVFEDWLYWTDWESESIYKVDKFSGRNVQTVASGVYSPMGVRVYHSYKQPKGRNYCGQINGNCSHLCLPAPQITAGSAKYTCACPDGMVLTDNKQNCLVIDAVTARPTPAPYTSFFTTRRTTVKVNPQIFKYDTVQPQTTTRRTSVYVPSTSTTSTTAKPKTRIQCACDDCKDSNYTCVTDGLCYVQVLRQEGGTLKYVYRCLAASRFVPPSDPFICKWSGYYCCSTDFCNKGVRPTSPFPTEIVTTTVESTSFISVSSQTVPQGYLMNETLREIQEEIDDSGKIAGIIIGVLGGLTIVISVVGFCIYKQYLRRNITSMNFDNPVYRKTTEDQFSLEKNQYQPARSYPSSLEPLTSPGTNEFV